MPDIDHLRFSRIERAMILWLREIRQESTKVGRQCLLNRFRRFGEEEFREHSAWKAITKAKALDDETFSNPKKMEKATRLILSLVDESEDEEYVVLSLEDYFLGRDLMDSDSESEISESDDNNNKDDDDNNEDDDDDNNEDDDDNNEDDDNNNEDDNNNNEDDHKQKEKN